MERGESSWARRKADGDPIRYGLAGGAPRAARSLTDAADRAAGGFGVLATSTTTGWEPTCAHGGEATGAPEPRGYFADLHKTTPSMTNGYGSANAKAFPASMQLQPPGSRQHATTGWDPACTHALDPVPATVLDPFSGAATTGLVAVRLGRSYIGIELNPEYARMGERRILADHGAVEPTNGHTPAEVRGVQGRLAL